KRPTHRIRPRSATGSTTNTSICSDSVRIVPAQAAATCSRSRLWEGGGTSKQTLPLLTPRPDRCSQSPEPSTSTGGEIVHDAEAHRVQVHRDAIRFGEDVGRGICWRGETRNGRSGRHVPGQEPRVPIFPAHGPCRRDLAFDADAHRG